jgi:hypothetical protein
MTTHRPKPLSTLAVAYMNGSRYLSFYKDGTSRLTVTSRHAHDSNLQSLYRIHSDGSLELVGEKSS